MLVTSAEVAPARPLTGSLRLDGRGYAVIFPLAVFLITRAVAGLFVVMASRHQVALGPDTFPGLFVYRTTPADPGYGSIIGNWDGQWYQSIATDGYQTTDPGEAVTHAKTWAWAFPPAYPLLVGILMKLMGVSFPVAASIVSGTAGAVAMVLLFRLLESAGGRWVASWGVVLSCCFVSAPLLQAAYSESLALCFLLCTLILIRRRSYWLALVPTLALSFTRLITPVLCVVVIVAVVGRVRAEGVGSVAVRERWGVTALVGYAALGALVWPTLAAMLMGDGARFNRSEQVVNGLGSGWFGQAWTWMGAAGVALVCGLLLILVLGAASPLSASWGVELRTWSVAYPLYVLALTPITGGVLRYALLAPTLGLMLVPGGGRSRRVRSAPLLLLAAVGLWCQWLFVRHLLVIDLQPLMP